MHAVLRFALASTFLVAAAAALPANAQAPIKQLAQGNTHYCSLDMANTVRCWGRNVEGQIGDGTHNMAVGPTVVAGLPGTIVKVGAGRSFSCALNEAGELWCWGDASQVMQGPGSATPKQMTFYAAPIADFWTGVENVCAALRSGDVVCTGSNTGMQLGTGSQADSATSVANLTEGVIDIRIGDAFPGAACALEPAGTVKSLGAMEGLSPMPRDMGLTGIRQIAAGAYHFCALTDAGGVKCWGNNLRGVLGTGNTQPSYTPVDVQGLPGPMSGIFAGSLRTCATTAAGALYCWGEDRYGSAGGPGNSSGIFTPIPVARARAGIRSAGLSLDVTCVLTEAGRVQCMGSVPDYGLGYPSTEPGGNPLAEVLNQSPRALALSERASCALAGEGTLRCWGDNSGGLYGDGSTESASAPVIAQTGLRDVAMGRTHACGIALDKTLRCWGDNTYGQLGNGTTGGSSASPVTVTGMANVTLVTVGDHHSCAAQSDGTLWCWGDNTYGQLGIGSNTPSAIPMSLGVVNARLIGAGENHTCLHDGATTRCWGRNHRGQLGDFTQTNRTAPVNSMAFPAYQLTLGANHTCVGLYYPGGLTQCWGDNAYGQLGRPASVSFAVFNATAGGISGYPRSLVAGRDHTCAVDEQGAVRCTGRNDDGQLGDNTRTNRYGFVPVAPSGAFDGAIVGSGGAHSCAMRMDGRVDCWGRNEAGQVGDGSTVDRLVRTAVHGAGQALDSFTMPAQGTVGSTLAVSASATSALPVTLSTTDATTCAPSGAGIDVSGGGFCVVEASQVGDEAYGAALPRSRLAWIAPPGGWPLQFDAIPDHLLSDAPFSITVTQVSGSPRPITIDRTTYATCDLAGSVVTLKGLGVCIIRAAIAGDATSPPQRIVRAFNVQQAQTIDFPAIADRALADTPFTLAATASSGLAVSFGSLTPDVCLVVGDQANLRAAGTCTIRASQAGNTNNRAADPVEQSFQVTNAGTAPVLTVTRSGGVDPVVSTPAGIDCGTTCSAALPQTVPGQPSTLVALAVTVTDGSFVTFANDDGPVTVQLDPVRVSTKVDFTADRTVSATFTAPGAIDVSSTGPGHVASTPAGIDCTSCSFTFPAYRPLTLSAVPNAGASFVRWEGGACDGQGANCGVTVQPTPQSATAIFASNTIVLASYALGEDDPGAAIGNTGNATTVDETGAFPLLRAGSPVYAAGATGQGLGMQFTGSGQRYSSGTAVSTSASNWVLEAWVKPVGDADYGTVAYVGVPGSNGFGIRRQPTGAYVAQVQTYTVGSGAVRPNEWTHLAVVRDNNQTRLFVNGSVDASFSVTDANPPSGSTVIGGDVDGSSVFHGTIDDVRVLSIQPGTFSPEQLNVRHLSASTGGTGATPTLTYDPPGGFYPTGTVVRVTVSVPFLNEITSVDAACVPVTQSTTQVTCDVTLDSNEDLLILTAPHAPTTPHLAITRSGGVDPIVSTPAGIDCGATCAADFSESDPGDTSTWIKLGVAPTDGSLVAITGADTPMLVEQSPLRVSAKVNLGSNRTVDFAFTPPGAVQVSVTGSGSVSSNPAGIDCGATCTFTFPGYSTTTLTATPGFNSIFVRWDTVPAGACTGSGASCTLAISGTPQQVTAVFSASVVLTSRYRLGEDDPGAVAGAQGNATTVDTLGGPALARGTSNPTYTVGAGGLGLGMSFRFGSGYLGSTAGLATTDGFGMSVWFRPDDASGGGLIFYTGNSCCNGAGIVRNDDGSYIGLLGGSTVVGHNAGPQPHVWTHLALIRANGRTQLYVNGLLDDEAEGSGMAFPAPSIDVGRTLVGSIDDARIFTIAGAFDPAVLDVRRLAFAHAGTGDVPAITLSPDGGAYPVGTVVRVTIAAALRTDITAVDPRCVPVSQTGSMVVCDVTMSENVDLAIERQSRAAQPVTVSVVRNGGSDPVVSTPAGIDCGSTCSASFTESDPVDEGTWITLATTVTDGSFVAFADADTAPTVTLNPTRVSAKVKASDRTVNVTFTQPMGLDVTIGGVAGGRVVSAPAGIDCTSGTCSYVFPAYGSVTLTAMPAPGAAFGRWTGPDCADQGAVCTFTISDASVRSVGAEFRLPFELLASYRLGESDPGAASGAPGAATTKDSAGTTDLTRSGTTAYAAGASDLGLGMAFDGASVYQSPTLALDETSDFGIEMWIDLGTDNQNYSVPVFVGDIYSGGGYGFYQEQNHIYAYTAWDGNIIGAGHDRTGWNHYALVREGRLTRLYVNGVLDAQFERDDLPAPSTAGGNKATSIGNTSYSDYGLTGRLDEVRFFRFAPGEFSAARLNVRSLTATVTGTAPTITYVPPGGAYPTDTTVRVTISAAASTVIQSFNPACAVVTQTPMQVTCDITLADNADLQVVTGAAPVQRTLTVVKAGAGSGGVTSNPAGVDCGATCAAAFNQGTVVTLSAAPSAGSSFTGWSGSSCSGIGPCAVTLDADASVTATFAVAKVAQSIDFAPLADRDIADTPFELSATASSGLTVSFASTTSATCNVTGTSVALIATGTCTIRASQGGDATYEPAADVDRSFEVTSGPAQATLTVTKGGAGQGRVVATGIDCGGDCSEAYAVGATVTLIATSGPGATFAEWSVAACGIAPVCTFTMDAERTVQALFDAHAPADPRVDFDHDGKADIVWTHADGRVAAWLMDGLTVAAGAEVVPAGSGWHVAQVADLDGDGRSDLVLQNADGSVAVYLMNGTTTAATQLVLPAGGGWTVTQAADLDGDGRADLVFQNADGTIAAYLMDGVTVRSGTTLNGAGSGWNITKVGDFDGDGNSDVLWTHADGRVAIWLMDGLAVKSSTQILNGGSGWGVAHVADLDGDGKSDLLWRNTDGTAAVWLMDGASMSAGANVLDAATGWTVTHMGDFDNDGNSDLLWVHDDGRVAIYLMDGLEVKFTQQILNAGSGWHVAAVKDLDGDGKADIVWQHDDGRVALWLMDGTATMREGAEILAPGTGWAVSPAAP
jgi:alpha-tubulin suppressor-like RCC1 family protein